MASTLKKRNGTLEFMRFIFCMTILFFHIGKYTYGSPSLSKGVFLALFPHGAMGVEFFFLLTGVFRAQSLDKQLQRADKIIVHPFLQSACVLCNVILFFTQTSHT